MPSSVSQPPLEIGKVILTSNRLLGYSLREEHRLRYTHGLVDEWLPPDLVLRRILHPLAPHRQDRKTTTATFHDQRHGHGHGSPSRPDLPSAV